MEFSTRIMGRRELRFLVDGRTKYFVRVRPVGFKPQNVRIAGLKTVADDLRFEIPNNKRILVVDPLGDNAASSMWNLLTVLTKKEQVNTITLAHVISEEETHEEEAKRFARSLNMQSISMGMGFPFRKSEEVPEEAEYGDPSFEDAENVAKEVMSLVPDTIFMPHYHEDINQHELCRKSSYLFLYAIASMIESEIKETCRERPESVFCDEGKFLLADKLAVYFYEKYSDFYEADVVPNVYNYISRESDLRLNYSVIFGSRRGNQRRLLDAMKKSARREKNNRFFLERFIAAEVEVFGIKVGEKDLIEMLSPQNYAARLIGRKEKKPEPAIEG